MNKLDNFLTRDRIVNLRDKLLWDFKGDAAQTILRVLFQNYLDNLEGSIPPPSGRQLTYEVDRPSDGVPWNDLSDNQRRAISADRIAQVRIIITQLRERLRNYFEKGSGRYEPVRVTCPAQDPATKESGYRLLFERRQPEPEESVRHLWAAYFPTSHDSSERSNVIVFTEPLFFRDDSDGELTYIRNIHANEAKNPSMLARLVGPERAARLTPSYHYLAAGEVMAVLHLHSLFHKNGAALRFRTVRAEGQAHDDIGDVNLILIGSSRTNPILAERQTTMAYRLLEHEVHVTDPQGPEEEAYRDQWGPASARGPFYKYAILTRIPNKTVGYAVTMIAANHGRAAEGVVDYLRHWENVDDLYHRMQFSVFESLPTKFQIIFRVPIHKEYGAAELGSAEPVVSRVFDSAGGAVMRRLNYGSS